MTSVKRGNETELGRPLAWFISARSISLRVSRFSVQRVTPLSKPHFHLFKADPSFRKFLRSTVTVLSTACSKVPTPCPKTFGPFQGELLRTACHLNNTACIRKAYIVPKITVVRVDFGIPRIVCIHAVFLLLNSSQCISLFALEAFNPDTRCETCAAWQISQRRSHLARRTCIHTINIKTSQHT